MYIEDVVAGDGKDGRPLYMFLNGKVIEFMHPDGNNFRNLIQAQKDKGTQSFAVFLNTFLYDPKYGQVKSFDDITKEMAAVAED